MSGWNIPLKTAIDKWIEHSGVKFKIKRPSADQEEILDELMVKIALGQDPKGYLTEIAELNLEIAKKKKKRQSTVIENNKVDKLVQKVATDKEYTERTPERITLLTRLMNLTIRFSVEDWEKGKLKYMNGEPFDCVLDGDQLEENCWRSLIADRENTAQLYRKIKNEIGLTDTDKKKSS